MKKVLKYLGYGAFFLFFFLAFLYLTFPYDKLRQFIVTNIQYPEKGGRRILGKFFVDIENLEPSWLTGMEFQNATIRPRPGVGDVEVADTRIEEGTVRVSLLSLLMGDFGGSFNLQIRQGQRVEGEFDMGEDTLNLDAAIEDVQLLHLPIVQHYAGGIPIIGEVSGNIDVSFSAEKSDTNGRIDLRARNLMVGDGKAKVKAGIIGRIKIDRIEAGALTFAMNIKDGVGKVKTLQAAGEDLKLEGGGTIDFNWPLRTSSPDLVVKVLFKESYKKKSPATESMFMLVESSPRARRALTNDGALQMRIKGTFGRISAFPDGAAKIP